MFLIWKYISNIQSKIYFFKDKFIIFPIDGGTGLKTWEYIMQRLLNIG